MTVEELVSEELKAGNFSRNLRVLRVLRGLEQRELAQRSGVGPDSISRLETGTTKPRPGTIKKLATALEVSPETLTGRPK